jgi:nitroreductase
MNKHAESYENFSKVVHERRSVRRFKSDPLPEGAIEKILECARWAMSGANAQPWELIVVRDKDIKKALWDAYLNVNVRYVFWMEQQRIQELRHPAFRIDGSPEDQWARYSSKTPTGWSEAPALIVVLGDGRRQWATVMGGHTFGRDMTHLTDGLANACQIIHLAAAALGLGTQWVTVHIQEPFKRILEVPDILTLHSIIPVGFALKKTGVGNRRPLSDFVHTDRYDPEKQVSDQEIIDYLLKLRRKTSAGYIQPKVSQGDDFRK